MEKRGCRYCGAEVLQPAGRGRPRAYCSHAHRQAAYRKRHSDHLSVPSELSREPRWVRRVGKRPVTDQGHPASSTNPNTWCSYERALSSEVGDGMGFVLGGGIGCIDLDHAIDDVGNLSRTAQEILAACPDTYVEVSMSGHGLHIFGYIQEGPGRVLKESGVEVYSTGRYIAVTGQRYMGSPLALADLQGVADSLR